MLLDILIPFFAVGIAELGDKTQLAVFCLASKTKRHAQLLLGVVLAFAVADGLAIILGNFLTNIMPLNYIKAGAGFVFILFGVWIMLNHRRKSEEHELKSPFLSAFGLILISEMGDKTQIAAGLFATEYNPIFVFIGVMAALACLSLVAVYIGKLLAKRINKKVISIIAGVVFMIIGLTALPWHLFVL